MGGVKTGRVKGAQCEMGGPANGNGGPAQGLAWLPSCSGSVVAVTVAAAGVPHHRTPRQVGYSLGGGHLGASKSWGRPRSRPMLASIQQRGERGEAGQGALGTKGALQTCEAKGVGNNASRREGDHAGTTSTSAMVSERHGRGSVGYFATCFHAFSARSSCRCLKDRPRILYSSKYVTSSSGRPVVWLA
jgi:hypothetical protein